MWICLNEAFLSVVASSRDPLVLNVRARQSEHLGSAFPKCTIHEAAGTDYPVRSFVPRPEVAQFLAAKATSITYTNFKDSVTDDDLHEAYMDVWQAMRRFQELKRRRGREA